ncbi:hypothetical protein [Kitasatospora sp. NPDC056184]|uniref:hypothetical protein n=1 Tax=Kitasatospora sp. NPDC056184 TaxID=3345738 RepID=UPI0035DEC83F
MSRATWVLALTAAADPSVVSEQIDLLDAAVAVLPQDVLRRVEEVSAPTALLLAYHDPDRTRPTLERLGEPALVTMARYGGASWPAVSVLTARMLRAPSPARLEALRACGPSVPSAHMTAHDFQPLTPSAAALFRHMVDRPAEYPREWVWGAQEVLAGPITVGQGHSSQPFLADIAAQERWFFSA